MTGTQSPAPGMMLAERFHADGRRVEVEEVPIPEPGPGQVRIKVAYCGICHSDLSLIHGAFPHELPVVTQGHEAAGTIDALGPGVTGWAVGDRVIPSAGRPCLKCRRCQRGDFTACLNLRLMAFAYDGGWAQYTVAYAMGMTRVPDEVDLKQAAILADAVSTPFGAVVRTGKVHPGNAVGVWGLGGVGTHIIQLSKLAGAVPIIGVDLNEECLERAERLGADHVFRADDPNLLDSIASATGGRMIDVAFDAVGIHSTLKQAVASLDNYGGGRHGRHERPGDEPGDLPRVQPQEQAGPGPPRLQDAGHRDARRDAALRAPRPHRVRERGGAAARDPHGHRAPGEEGRQPDPHPRGPLGLSGLPGPSARTGTTGPGTTTAPASGAIPSSAPWRVGLGAGARDPWVRSGGRG